MNREAARTIKPFPTAVTDMFPCFGKRVMTVLRVCNGTGRLRRTRRRGTPGIEHTQFLSEERGEKHPGARVGRRIHSVENELGSDETRARFRSVVAWFYDIFCERGVSWYITIQQSMTDLGRDHEDLGVEWETLRERIERWSMVL